MWLHIEFEDGSNPYIFYGKNFKATKADIQKEVKRWSKNFDLRLIGTTENFSNTSNIGYWYKARAKEGN